MSHEAVNDPLFEAVKQFVLESRIPSVSHIQIEFRIGYGRAACMLEALEGELVTTKDDNGFRKMLAGYTRDRHS